MKQTGTYHVYEVKGNQRVISPIANAFIYFIADGAIKLKTQTDDKGKYNFDLPLGEYTVASASEGGIEQILANGSKFILTAQSTEKAFEEWVNAPSADVDSALLKRFKELAKISEDAAREASEILTQVQGSLVDYRKLDNNLFESVVQVKAKNESNPSALYLTDPEGNSRLQVSYANTGLQIIQAHADKTFQMFTTPLKSGEFALKADVDKKWDIQETVGSGKVIKEGFAGLGNGVKGVKSGKIQYNTFISNGQGAQVEYPQTYSGVHFYLTEIYQSEIAMNLVGGKAWLRWFIPSGEVTSEIFHSRNTTVDSNGFIKKASPIIKLFNDRIETNDQFYNEPIFEKIGKGTYKISNTKGLSKEGWSYEKPRGGDGTPYFRIEVTKLEDGCIISVHDEYDSLEEATITDINGNTRKINKVVKVLGEARDIKLNERWIDLRFEEDHERIKLEEEKAQREMQKSEAQAVDSL